MTWKRWGTALDRLPAKAGLPVGIGLGALAGALLLLTPAAVWVPAFLVLLTAAGVLAWSGEPVEALPEPPRVEPVLVSPAIAGNPVEVPPHLEQEGEVAGVAHRAPLIGAHNAGTNNLLVRDVEDLGEVTATVLAYVAYRVQGVDPPLTDCERVLCFDMGGDGTDLAAMEVLQMASYFARGDTRVILNLMSEAGSRFGGDNLDRMLAFIILAEVKRQSEERGAPVAIEIIQLAILSPSYPAFKSHYFERRHAPADEQAPTAKVMRTESEALGIYKLATEILKKAEEVKLKLSISPKPELIMLPGIGWPRERPGAQVVTMNFEVELRRGDFEKKVREEVRLLLHLLDNVVNGADWDWPSVTTLLFTGQNSRIPVIQEEVAAHVAVRRGPGAPPLLLLKPEQTENFVAIGTALWEENRTSGSWLDIRTPFRDRLTFNLEMRFGPRFRPVPGLEQGTALPAQAVISVKKGQDALTLHRYRSAYIRFRFPPLRESRELTIRVDGPGDFTLFIDGEGFKGEVIP